MVQNKNDPLRAVVVIDYQNIHLTGRDQFKPEQRAGDWIIDPVQFAIVGLEYRNASQRAGYPSAELAAIKIFRGQPSPTHDPALASAAMRQQAVWSRHPLATVTYRPLKYAFPPGRRVVEEKGIDVLCCLEVVRALDDPDVDLVVLATHDTDLEPVLDYARGGEAKVETLGWLGAKKLRPSEGRLWNTSLGYEQFERCLDPKDYFPR